MTAFFRRVKSLLITAMIITIVTALYVPHVYADGPCKTIPSLKKSDVVFMYRAKPEDYKAYRATYLGWGGHPRTKAGIDSFSQRVKKTQSIGVRYAAGIGWLTEAAGFIDFAPDFLDAVCLSLEGEKITVPWLWDHTHKGHPYYLFMDIHPSFKAYIERNTRWSMKAKPDAFHIDDLLGSCAIGASISKGGTFNKEYITGFREYLKHNVPKDSLAAYGISDIDNFDYASFLRSRTDRALIDYYRLYTLKSTISVVSWLKEVMRDELGYDIPLSGNAAFSSWRHLPFAPVLDYLSCEVHEDAQHGLTGAPLLDYKLSEALGKPIAATGFGGEWAFVKKNDVPGLVRGWIAQGYAFGQNYMAPNRQWCYTKELGTHWYSGRREDYAPLFQFIRRNAELFDDYVPFEDVGLLLSFANYRRSQTEYRQLPMTLASLNVPFGVVIAGDEWLDMQLSPELLGKYHNIVIPPDLILDSKQQEMLNNWVLWNNIVVWRGKEDFLRRYVSPFQLSGADNIWMVPRVKPGDERAPLVIHLLNRNYLPSIDKYAQAPPFTISIDYDAFPDRTFYRASLYSYNEETKRLNVRTKNNIITIEVPGLDQWAIVTLR